MAVRVSDHALLRFLERAGGLDVEAMRASIAMSLARAVDRAQALGSVEFVVIADGLKYVVRLGTVVTVLHDEMSTAAKPRAGVPE